MKTGMLAAMAAMAGFALPATSEAQKETPRAGGKDLVQVATEAGSFSTLLEAIEAAGLVEVLRGPGPFTVFAPTDAAFAKLPKGTLESLLADKKQLAAVLTYHVVPGRVLARDVVQSGGAEPTTVQGERLTIVVKDGRVQVDGATVTTADVMASNGVIHVIDAVVLPGRKAAMPAASAGDR